MTEEREEQNILKLLNFQFKGYAEDSELIMAYCLKFFVNDIRKGNTIAHATIEKLEEKKCILITEANAGKHFYKLTDKGKRQLSV